MVFCRERRRMFRMTWRQWSTFGVWLTLIASGSVWRRLIRAMKSGGGWGKHEILRAR